MARFAAQMRPTNAEIFAFCPDETITRTLAMARGVTAYHLPFTPGDGETAISQALDILRQQSRLQNCEKLIIISDVLHSGANTDGIWVRENICT
jgi:pyruvate kinase